MNEEELRKETHGERFFNVDSESQGEKNEDVPEALYQDVEPEEGNEEETDYSSGGDSYTSRNQNNWRDRQNNKYQKKQKNPNGNNRLGNRFNDVRRKRDVSNYTEQLEKKASGVSNLKDKAGKATEKAKEVGKGVQKVGSSVVDLIKKNPKAALILGGILLVIVLVLLLILALGNSKNNGDNTTFYCGEGCDGVPFNYTTLNKQQFIDLYNEYYETHVTGYESIADGRRIFKENIDTIYDTSIAYGINPEIIVVRAMLEGFSPGNLERETNNFWGMGCTNKGGGADCAVYSTFQEGLNDYAKKAKRFDNYTDLIDQYAYLGDYWYNPGSSAQGGCYLFNELKEFLSDKRISEVEPYCTDPNKLCSTTDENNPNCLPTNEEDDDALTKYHVKEFLEQRKIVFKLEPMQQEVYDKIEYSGNYPINPDAEIYKNLKTLHGNPNISQDGYPYSMLLSNKGYTVESFNSFLKNEIEKAGVGTRAGVIAAAMTLIGANAEMGYKLNYRWGGKYGKIGVNPKWGDYLGAHCDGFGARFGSSEKCLKNYLWGGMDCSGFVHWALVNGMQNSSLKQQNTTTSPYPSYQKVVQLDPNRAVCRPGGVLVSSGHIVLVVGVDSEKKKYIIAESTGNFITDDKGGNRLKYYSFNQSGYVCKNLEEIYGD